MAFEVPIMLQSFPSTGDLSAAQFQFVKMDIANAGNVILCAAATDIPIGVLQNNPKAGQTASVCVIGGTKLTAGAALTVGALIGPDATGRGVALVAGTDITKYVCGAVTGATTAINGIASAVVNCATPHRAT